MIFGISVIERCPYYRGVRKERLHCISFFRSRERRFVSKGPVIIYRLGGGGGAVGGFWAKHHEI